MLNDNTVRIGQHIIDTLPPLNHTRARVDVLERFDGSIAVYPKGECLVKKS